MKRSVLALLVSIAIAALIGAMATNATATIDPAESLAPILEIVVEDEELEVGDETIVDIVYVEPYPLEIEVDGLLINRIKFERYYDIAASQYTTQYEAEIFVTVEAIPFMVRAGNGIVDLVEVYPEEGGN